MGSPSVGRRRLLGVLEDAAMAEVIDMAAKKHQLRVRVLGHCAVWWGGVVRGGGHQCCFSAGKALTSALGHGTESAMTCRPLSLSKPPLQEFQFLFWTGPESEDVSFPPIPTTASVASIPILGVTPFLSVYLLCHWGTTPARASLLTTCQFLIFSKSSTITPTLPNHSTSDRKQFFSSKKIRW